MLRTACITFALFTLVGCSKKEEAPTRPEPTPAPPTPTSVTSTTSVTTTSTAKDAVGKLQDALKAKGKKVECLSFLEEVATKTHVEIEVRENHTPPCAGDPNVTPVLGRFRVEKDGAIQTYDVVEDRWAPLDGSVPSHANAAPAITKVRGKEILSKELTFDGGKHRIVLSAEDRTVGGRELGRRLFAYDFCDGAKTPGAACWKIEDGIDDCDEGDLSVDFVGDKVFVKEIGGKTAVAVLYRMNCSTDVSAYTQKLIGYRDGVKFAVRGKTGLSVAGDKWPAQRTPDVKDAELRAWALASWDRYGTIRE